MFNTLATIIPLIALFIFTIKTLSIGYSLARRLFASSDIEPLPFRFVTVDDEYDYNDLFDQYYMTDGINFYNSNGEILFNDVIE